MNKRIPSLQQILFLRFLIIVTAALLFFGVLVYNAATQILTETVFRHSSSRLEVLMEMVCDEQERPPWNALEHGRRLQNTPYYLLDREYSFLFPEKNEGTPEEMRRIADAARMVRNRKTISIGGKNYYILTVSTAEKGYRLVQLIPRSRFSREYALIGRIVLLMGVLILILSLTVVYILLRQNLIPLLRLVDIIGYIEEGQFSKQFIDASTEESYLISRRINQMVERMNRLSRENLLMERKSVKAEIKALQTQINPHFLFNTLNTIKSMALNDKTKEISQITNDLAGMLRYGIYDLDSPTSIENELKNIAAYIKIQSHRFRRQYGFTVDCPEKLKSMCCTKFILQPLVENSVKHGLKNDRPGGITVRVRRDGLLLLIEVEDDGEGMNPEALEEMVRNLDREAGEAESIGLKNVHQRIGMIYGRRYGLKLHSEEGKGFRVTVTIPVRGSVKKQEGMYL